LALIGAALLAGGSEAPAATTPSAKRGLDATPGRAVRIVSLAPHLTEILFMLGAGARLVGTVAHSDRPDEARSVARVGDAGAFDLERIVALEPDLVVAWRTGNPQRQVQRLRGAGLNVHVSEPRTLEDIAALLHELGALTGETDAARAIATRYRARLDTLRARYQGTRPVRVFYQVWPQPLMTIGDAHVISDALRLCGGVNLFGSTALLVPRVGLEAVLEADPHVIVTGVAHGERGDAFANWRQFRGLGAVAAGRLVVAPSDVLHRQTPHILDAVEHLCREIERVRSGL